MPATAALTDSPPRAAAVVVAVDGHDDIPTVSLTPTVAQIPNVDVVEGTTTTTTAAEFSLAAATATAELVDVEVGGEAPRAPETSNAEFVSATIVKKLQEDSLGINLRSGTVAGEIFVDSIEDDSPLREAISAGFKIVSINGKNSFDLDEGSAASLLRTLVGTITIVAHNAQGNAQIAAATVEKPSPTSPVGIGLRQFGHARLEVTKVDASGLFAHSLVNVGDRLLFINQVDCRHLEAAAAIEAIRNTPKYVTVTTEIQSSVGVVLAAAAERTSSSSQLATAIPLTLNDEMNSLNSIHFCYCLWMIIISLAVIGLVINLQ